MSLRVRTTTGRRRQAARRFVPGGAAIVMMTSTLLFLQPTASEAGVTVTSHFVATGTSSNTTGDSLFLNNFATNNEPNDLLFVTQNWDANGVCGCVYQPATVGVWYDETVNQWAVFLEDEEPMVAGASFNVLVVPTASSSVFVQTATVSNTSGDSTFINSPLTNGNPKAMLQVTQNWDPGGVVGGYNTVPVGVWYDSAQSKWAIFNEDQSAMTVGLSFNVMVGATPSNGGKGVVLKATASNTNNDVTTIDNTQTTGNPNTVVFATPVYNPGGKGGTLDDNIPGVGYNSIVEQVFNEDELTMAKKTAFNLLIFSS